MLNVSQSSLTISRLGRLPCSCFGVRTLDVKKRSWCLGVAKGNLAERAFHDERLVLGAGFGGFHSTRNLLLHSLHVVVAASRVMATAAVAVPAARLKEVGLSELVQRLARTTARRSPDLSIHLIVEVFGELLFAPRFIVNTTCGGQ